MYVWFCFNSPFTASIKFSSENNINSIKTAIVENIVYSHLVDFDINEIGSSCLPNVIEKNQNGYFEGIFFVQVFLK